MRLEARREVSRVMAVAAPFAAIAFTLVVSSRGAAPVCDVLGLHIVEALNEPLLLQLPDFVFVVAILGQVVVILGKHFVFLLHRERRVGWLVNIILVGEAVVHPHFLRRVFPDDLEADAIRSLDPVPLPFACVLVVLPDPHHRPVFSGHWLASLRTFTLKTSCACSGGLFVLAPFVALLPLLDPVIKRQ